MVNIFKFPTLGSAKFVTERLSQMGLKAAYMPSGYIRVEEMTQEAETLIKESLGTHVAAVILPESVAPVVASTDVEDLNRPKYAGTGQGKHRAMGAGKAPDAISPPTANRKVLPKYGKAAKPQRTTLESQDTTDQELLVREQEPVTAPTQTDPKAVEVPKQPDNSGEDKKSDALKKVAYSYLKKMVEKSPSKYPKIANMLGIKVKGKTKR